MLINEKINGTRNTEHVKFISYTGKYPTLCFGILTLEIDGKKVGFGYGPAQSELESPFWESGGTTNWHSGHVASGEWIIDVDAIPDRYKKYANEIDYVFNKNVEHGCCGGCL